RGGQLFGQLEGRAPGCGDHSGGITRELRRLIAGVAADDDAEALTHSVFEEPGQPGGGTDDHGPIHPIRSRGDLTAQTGRAEDQGACEPIFEVGDGRLVAGLGLGEDVLQSRRRLRIRVIGDPGADHLGVESGGETIGYAGHGVLPQSFATISASSCEMRGAAAAPASMTSAWVSGVSWMPAARLVTNEMPMSSRPT